MANNNIGPLWVKCPACKTSIAVPTTVDIVLRDGRHELVFDPDMADLWAHAWTHDTEAGQ